MKDLPGIGRTQQGNLSTRMPTRAVTIPAPIGMMQMILCLSKRRDGTSTAQNTSSTKFIASWDWISLVEENATVENAKRMDGMHAQYPHYTYSFL